MPAFAPVDRLLQLCKVFEVEFDGLPDVDVSTFQPRNGMALIELEEPMERVAVAYPVPVAEGER
jgi:hypothetical protein